MSVYETNSHNGFHTRPLWRDCLSLVLQTVCMGRAAAWKRSRILGLSPCGLYLSKVSESENLSPCASQPESWVLQWHLALITPPTNRFLFKELRDTAKIFPDGSHLYRSTLIIVFSHEQLQMPPLAFTIMQRILFSRVMNLFKITIPRIAY